MTRLLIRKILGRDADPHDPQVRARCGALSGGTGIVLNLLLFAVKLAAGVLSGAISIVADSVNNLSDAATSVITLVGFRISARKEDREHPFGHGRYEYLAGLAVSVMIILMGAELVQESIARILSPSALSFGPVIAGILFASILVKLFLYFLNHNLAGLLDSASLNSTARDAGSDCVATAAVLLALLIQHTTGLMIDGICGLAVAVLILRTGVHALIDTVNPLLGAAPDPDLVARIKGVVLRTPGVMGMHDLVIHDYGPGRRMMTLHLEVPADQSLTEAHDLADTLENRLEQEFGLKTVIHVDPMDTADQETSSLQHDLETFLRGLDPAIVFHDFRFVRIPEGKRILHFDLNIPFGYPQPDEEILTLVMNHLQAASPETLIAITIEHYEF